MKNPKDIQDLFERREKLRNEQRFEEADQIRQLLVNRGYNIVDTKDSSELIAIQPPEEKIPKTSFLTLFGSGEIAPTGRSIHDYILNRINKDNVRIALLTTPAGFQPNVSVVYEEIRDFFNESLKNYHPQVDIVYANNKDDANNLDILDPLREADYIFTGPGSPTYAIVHLRDTLAYNIILHKVTSKTASLALASAATIAFSHYSLPVYEIYKVGMPLYWEKGLNFYKEIFNEVSIIPHFDNTEGGDKTDTSRCYIGKERFDKMLNKLPVEEALLGIDEHTAYVIDLVNNKTNIMGKGSVYSINTR